MAGPVVSSLTDMFSLAIYFLCATMILGTDAALLRLCSQFADSQKNAEGFSQPYRFVSETVSADWSYAGEKSGADFSGAGD